MASNSNTPTQPPDPNPNQSPNQEMEPQKEEQQPLTFSPSDSDSDSDSDLDSDSDSDSDYVRADTDVTLDYVRPGDEPPENDDNSREANSRRFAEVLNSRRLKRKQEEEDRNYVYAEDLFDFPKDKENWREEDLQEMWADAPLWSTKPGWDPVWADEEDLEAVEEEVENGRDPPIAPFYLPYRKPYPVIPDNHYDIDNPKAVVEELDRIEEFLTWVSYIFPDGSSYVSHLLFFKNELKSIVGHAIVCF